MWFFWWGHEVWNEVEDEDFHCYPHLFFSPFFPWVLLIWFFSVLLQLLFVLSSFLWIGLHRAYNFFIANSWWWPLTSHGWYHIYMCFVLWASFFQLWVGKMWFLLHFIAFFDSIPHCYVHGLTYWNNKKNSKSDKSVIYCHLLWCTCFMQLILS